MITCIVSVNKANFISAIEFLCLMSGLFINAFATLLFIPSLKLLLIIGSMSSDPFSFSLDVFQYLAACKEAFDQDFLFHLFTLSEIISSSVSSLTRDSSIKFLVVFSPIFIEISCVFFDSRFYC